jgi:hypothetical protein
MLDIVPYYMWKIWRFFNHQEFFMEEIPIGISDGIRWPQCTQGVRHVCHNQASQNVGPCGHAVRSAGDSGEIPLLFSSVKSDALRCFGFDITAKKSTFDLESMNMYECPKEDRAYRLII